MDTTALPDVPLEARGTPSPKVIVALIVLAAFTIFITWRARLVEKTLTSDNETPPLVEKVAPEFSAATLDGRTVALADFRGQKKVVVGFWASWCGPCRLEMADLVDFYKTYHRADSDFEILAVSIDDDTQAAAKFATDHKLNFPVLLDPRRKIADAYRVDGLPVLLVIDKDGKIIYGHMGLDGAMRFNLMRELGIRRKNPVQGAE